MISSRCVSTSTRVHVLLTHSGACWRAARRPRPMPTVLLRIAITALAVPPTAAAPGSGPEPAAWTAVELQRRVRAAVARSAAVAAPGGDYIFTNASLRISGARRGFVLRAANPIAPVRLWFDIGHGLVVEDSTDALVQGPIELDYTSGAYYQGTITAAPPTPSLPPAAAGACYRRAHVVLSACLRTHTHDLWVRGGGNSSSDWTRHPATNCYPGHGAAVVP
eukprot:COSAG01_NODE_564_length_15447_cov_14.174811_15_plen_221_part_00